MPTFCRAAFVTVSLVVFLSALNAEEPAGFFSISTAKHDLAARERQILDLVSAGFAAEKPNSAASSAAAAVTRGQKFVRVTGRPVRIEFQRRILCAKRNVPNGPHGDHWIDVFVTEEGAATMRSGKGVYPQGTIILKQKYADAAGTKTDLFTGMLKREKDYHPEVGDWEFFVLNSNRTRVTELGRIESCIDCHVAYKHRDFVSRDYLTGNRGQ
jgi:hypothetical protein